MTTSATLTDHPPGGAVVEGEPLATALQDLRERVESIAQVVDALRPVASLAQQAPALAAVIGDAFDDVMRRAMAGGVDVERGLINGAEAALRFGATMDARKVAELEALLQSGVLDPAAVRAIGDLGRALVDTTSAAPRSVGILGLLKALGDPDVQRALGFLVSFAERFGRRLSDTPRARP